MKKKNYSRFNKFQEAIANAEPNDWRCRAGSRFLMSAKTAWYTIVPNSGATRGSRSRNTGQADLKREYPDGEELRPELYRLMRASDLLP